MRLVIEITSEPELGKKIWLRQGQIAEVGRSRNADFTLPHDRLLSDVHFALDCTAQECRLRDLNSSNGTSVNGLPVQECTLRDRDTIVAGQTQFAVQLEGARASSVVVPSSLPEPAAAREAMTARHDRLTIGPWVCQGVPSCWELIPNQGFRWTGQGSFPTSLLFLQSELPNETTLEKFVASLIKQFVSLMPDAEVEGPITANIAGADEAIEFILKHSKCDRYSICQRFLYARQDQTIGSVTLTTSAAELPAVASSLEHIFQGLFLNQVDRS